jgi:hypothetical protein
MGWLASALAGAARSERALAVVTPSRHGRGMERGTLAGERTVSRSGPTQTTWHHPCAAAPDQHGMHGRGGLHEEAVADR